MSKQKLQTFTIKDIRDLNPCYDPSKFLPENWKGTLIDILNIEECPAEDKIWVTTRLAPRLINEIFAIDCACSAAAYVAAYAASAAYVASYAASASDAAASASYAAAAAAAAADAYTDADAAYTDADADARRNQIDALKILLKDKELAQFADSEL